MKQIILDDAALVPAAGHTSKGDQPKWQIGSQWYKADHMGYEALVECLVSSLLKKTNLQDFVTYEPIQIMYRGRTLRGCVSKNFRGKDEMLVPLERLHRAYHGSGLAEAIAALPEATDRIRYTVDFVESVTGLTGFGPYLSVILELDCLFLNEDRHTNNLAVVRNEKTGVYRFCPIFDNGLALLSDLNDYPLDNDVYHSIGRVQAKPFSMDFDEQVESANVLYGSHLRCSFTRSDVTSILESFSDFYPPEILSRVERVLFEQIRRYSIYFI